MGNDEAPDQGRWDPNQRLQDLKQEQAVLHDGENEKVAAQRIFRENLLMAVSSICHLASYSTNDRIRFDASKYVVERSLGQLRDVPGAFEDSDDPLERLLAESVREFNDMTAGTS